MEFDKPLADKMKAHLTQDELDRIEHIRPQMTYTTTHFIKLLIKERIQKAALLAACELAVYRLCIGDGDIQARINEVLPKLRAAIEQAGEGVYEQPQS